MGRTISAAGTGTNSTAPFVTDNVVAEVPVRYFDQSNMNRYTVVTWIEGYDPQSGGDEAPEGASIKLGVEINAYENE